MVRASPEEPEAVYVVEKSMNTRRGHPIVGLAKIFHNSINIARNGLWSSGHTYVCIVQALVVTNYKFTSCHEQWRSQGRAW